MDIYEKKYKEALAHAREIHRNEEEKRRDMEFIFPELKESEDENIRKEIIAFLKENLETGRANETWSLSGLERWIAWLEKQGERKPTQEIEPFEAEHGKYYYCIKDYFCGGRKQASKGDVVQALRGLPIMGLKDASEYFLPVNFIKCNHALGEEDEHRIELLKALCEDKFLESAPNSTMYEEMKITINWLKSLRPQPKQEWTEEDERILDALISSLINERFAGRLEFLKGIKVSLVIDWLKSLKQRIKKEAV